MAIEAHPTLRTATQPDTTDLMSEVRLLREVLNDAVRVLARQGVTPAAFATLPEAERRREVWKEATRVWAAAGVPPEPPPRVVLRCSDGSGVVDQEYASPQKALEAAIAAIEANERYPEAIRVDDDCIMDRASILRAWEDRHDPG